MCVFLNRNMFFFCVFQVHSLSIEIGEGEARGQECVRLMLVGKGRGGSH